MIWTVPASCSFSEVLAENLMKKYQGLSLAQVTLILPSRRAVKAIKDAFLKKTKNTALMLPHMVSLYDLEGMLPDISPPIDEIEQLFILIRLIRQKQETSYAKAVEIAQNLALFMDELITYDVPFEALSTLSPDDFAKHWQQTLSFLEIIGKFYPEILKERGKSAPAFYHKKLLEKIAADWKENPPAHPVIAAGFNGGLPTINRFLKEINAFENTDIILPYLDKNLTPDEWEKLDETHPQYMLRTLLKELDITPDKVCELALNENPRQNLATRMMAPVSLTHLWQKETPLTSDVLKGISLMESATADEEALSIALILREVLETPNKTAALVTPNRTLAKRVIAHMRRWQVLLDDSGGTPLYQTPVGRFFLQLAEAAASPKVKEFLILLKNPLSACGENPVLFRKKIQLLEKRARENHEQTAFFKPDLPPGSEALFNLFVNPVPVPLEELIRAHIQTAEAFAASDDRTAQERLWSKEDGILLSELFIKLLEHAKDLPPIEPIEYPAFLRSLLSLKSVRPKFGMHPRLDILGVMESRLQQPDLIVIGGLNEGTFPEAPSGDLWLSRPMREQLNLPLPEEKIGIAANDFIHAFMGKEVVLSRALKENGTPTIQSRWLLRMETVLKASGLTLPAKKHPLVAFLRPVPKVKPSERPMPCPPVSVRPNKISVTGVETWMKDPYSIYAKEILKLKKLDDLGKEPSSAEFGTAFHRILKAFLSLPLNERTDEKLEEISKKSFEEQGLSPERMTFLKPKFDRAMRWIKENQPSFIPFTEEEAHLNLNLKSGKFTLSGCADRIDIINNEATLIDYKSGTPPKPSEVRTGFAPQLLLEGFLLEKGGFKNIGTKKVAQMDYIQLSGKNEGAQVISIVNKDHPPESLIQKAEQNLMMLIDLFRDKNTPYTACPHAGRMLDFNDYAHLERLAEWQNNQEEEEDD